MGLISALVVAATWAYGFALAIPAAVEVTWFPGSSCIGLLMLPAYYQLILSTQIIAIFAIILATYLGITLAVRSQLRRIANHQGPLQASDSQMKAKIPILKTCFMVVTVYALCHLPMIIFLSMNLSQNARMNSTVTNLWSFAVFLILFNTLINPVIYFLRIPEFKTIMKANFFRCCKVQTNGDGSSVP